MYRARSALESELARQWSYGSFQDVFAPHSLMPVVAAWMRYDKRGGENGRVRHPRRPYSNEVAKMAECAILVGGKLNIDTRLALIRAIGPPKKNIYILSS